MSHFTDYRRQDRFGNGEPPLWFRWVVWSIFFAICMLIWAMVFFVLLSMAYALNWIYDSVL